MIRPATLLGVDSLLEGATGLALMLAPGLVVWLLFAAPVEGIGVVMARLAGIALFCMALACWVGRTGATVRPLLLSLGAFNVLAFLYLAFVGLGTPTGILLWPAVVIHAVMAGFFAVALRRLSNKETQSE